MTPGDALRDKVARALGDLGDTPELVAAILEAHGCRGDARIPESCPVSAYLRQLVTPESVVSVCPWNVLVHTAEAMVMVALPKAVEQFVRLFDRRGFRALERRHVPHRPRPDYRLLEPYGVRRLPVLVSVVAIGPWQCRRRLDWLSVN